MANFIKSGALNPTLFSKLCSEISSEYIQFLLHVGVRWLSRGSILSRLFELYFEVQLFLIEIDFTTEHEIGVNPDFHYNIKRYCQMKLL